MAQAKTQCIAIELENGKVAIMHYILEDIRSGMVREATDEAIKEEIRKTGLPMVSWKRVNPEEIPADRTFRNAWKADLTVDIKAAKEIYKDKIREIRKPLLEALDVEYQRADEQGNSSKKKEIAAKKQLLRDCTEDPHLLNAKTPEELKSVWPECLGKRKD